jgi:hypothetical protein
MSGIFYDSATRRLYAVDEAPDPAWTLVTHNVNAGPHQCRRIMREWLSVEEIWNVDWLIQRERRTA